MKNFFRANDAIAAVELALLMPLMLALLLGVFEMGRFLMLTQKIEKMNYTVADVVAQSETIQASDLQNLLSAADEMMSPFTFGNNGRVIISSVVRGTTTATVRWQYCGGGTLSAMSSIGSVNGTAALPSGFTMTNGEDIVIAETFYRFVPLVGAGIIGTRIIHKAAYFRPRLGALSNFTSSCQ